jgi:chemotaxis protein MotB
LYDKNTKPKKKHTMKNALLYVSAVALLLTSCGVPKQQFEDLQARYQKSQDDLNSATLKLNTCLEEKAQSSAQVKTLQDQVAFLKDQNNTLTSLTSKGATNLEKTLESIREKDLKINRMQDALTKRDSMTLALVTSLKGALGDLNDQDIEINVEKGVVYVSISDKLLFSSGSYNVTARAKAVLGKVAKVVNAKPELEFMVEGHTDNVPIKNEVLLDNWDLSVKRATSVVRVLQNDFGVNPNRMVAAGRSYYVPLASNDTAEDRAKNRRTRIIVLPKLDQFYTMIEEGMKQ